MVLTKTLRHKLWMYDVVSGLVGLHHLEAAVAPTGERPSEQKLDSYFWHTLTDVFNIHLLFWLLDLRREWYWGLVVWGLVRSWAPAYCLSITMSCCQDESLILLINKQYLGFSGAKGQVKRSLTWVAVLIVDRRPCESQFECKENLLESSLVRGFFRLYIHPM